MKLVSGTGSEVGGKDVTFSHTCDWDKATGLLLDSEITSVDEHTAWQLFSVIHPRLGGIKILLCTVDKCLITLDPEGSKIHHHNSWVKQFNPDLRFGT